MSEPCALAVNVPGINFSLNILKAWLIKPGRNPVLDLMIAAEGLAWLCSQQAKDVAGTAGLSVAAAGGCSGKRFKTLNKDEKQSNESRIVNHGSSLLSFYPPPQIPVSISL